MRIAQTLLCQQTMKQWVYGSFTPRSIFPRVEEWLNGDSDRQSVISELSHECKNDYKCSIDLLFCETFREHRKACLLYYRKRGPALRKILRRKEIELYERGLLYALKMAYERFVEDRLFRWSAIAGATRLYLEDFEL